MTVRKINIYNSEISVLFGLRDDDYICLTDMVKAGDNSERTNIVIQIGCAAKTLFPISVCGKICIILILKASNSMQLEMLPVLIVLSLLLRSG